MRPEANSLDLNNFPEDFCSRDAAQASGDSSSSAGGYRKKKSGGGKEDKDEGGKVYECRFCSLKFCKSQALGGHMNRHRQERETETLNKARQLVFSNDLAPPPPPPPPPHLGYVSSGQAISHGGYHQQGTVDDTSLHFRSMYPSRMYPTSPIILPPPPLHPYPSPPPQLYGPGNDYYVGHVVPAGSCYGGGGGPNRGSYYTCIGAPVAQNSGGGGEVAVQNQEEGLNWGRR